MRIVLFLLLFPCCVPVLAQGYQDGDSTFNYPVIHTIHFTFLQPSFWDSLMAYHSLDKPMVGTVSINGQVMDSVGVGLKGNSSFNSMPGVKKSFKISFDEYRNQKYDGLKTLNLNNAFKDPTFLREKLTLDFLRRQGAPAPRCSYADVFVNGTHWGFYTVVEQVNKTFLNDVIGNKDGNLFKGDPHGTLQWKGSSTQSLYESSYELKTNETLNDWSDLIHLIDEINNTPASQFHDSLETVLNTDLFIKYWAALNLFVNLDSYLGSGHNYYAYHNTATNLFDLITWDVNESFGNFQMGMTLTQLKNLDLLWVSAPAGNRPLVNNMINNTVYRTAYLDRVYQYVQNDFSPWVLYPVMDSLANVIRPYVYADPNKQFTNQNFDFNIDHDMGNIPGLKDFIAIRRSNLSSQLAGFGYSPLGLNELTDSPEGILRLYPNPARSEVYIDLHNFKSPSSCRLEILDLNGQVLGKQWITTGETGKVSLKEMDAGLYFYRIFFPGGAIFKGKLVVL